jgi:hypothetical protein
MKQALRKRPAMVWLLKHPVAWRLAALALLLAALLGPWMYDRVNVPAQYDCSPYIRLEGEFCGFPMSGLRLISWVVVGVISNLMELLRVSGDIYFSFLSLLSLCLYILSVLLIELPIFSTLLLILCGDRLALKIFQVAAWILAGGIALFIGLHAYPAQFQHYWGVWLYILTASSALVIELLMLLSHRTS